VASVDAKETTTHERAVKSVRGRWYESAVGKDAQPADHYRTPVVQDPKDNIVRESGRVAIEDNSKSQWNWALPLGEAIYYLFVFALVAFFVGLFFLAVVYFTLGSSPFSRQSRQIKMGQIDLARIEMLPLQLDQQSFSGDPLAEARRFAAAGDFNKAVLYLYAYQLLSCDHARLIHLQRGKTNRVYLEELKPHPKLQQLVEQTVSAFELVYFGKREATQAVFDRLASQIETYQQLLQWAMSPVEASAVSDEHLGLAT
jgi:hypothetical protein